MNANQEFISHIETRKVKCAEILGRDQYDELTDSYKADGIYLKVNYSEDDYQSFLSQLDFNYDSGYGGQELYGIIWYEDGTWSSRGEYDGSEWREHNECPVINEKCF
jgi:hypothetical protein